MVGAINIAMTGLDSALKRLNASAANIANLQTVGSLNGGTKPYTPLTTTQQTVTDGNGNALGVKSDYAPITDPFVPAYDPDSPFADQNGLIGVPNISLPAEIVNMKLAAATYKANLATIKVADDMTNDLLRVFDKKA